MHILYRGLLFVICLAITVECQGGGGGGHGGGGSFSGGSSYRGRTGGSSCTGKSCAIIWGSIVGGMVGIGLLIFGIYFFVKHRKGRPSQINVEFTKTEATKSSEDKTCDITIFKSGFWKSQYFQYGKWHASQRFSLSFDAQSMKVTGSGFDDIGTFTIDGTYTIEAGRIGITKQYLLGTGNRSENLGHQVTIQLTWHPNNNQFEGKWYVQTNKYHGEDKFLLKFDGPQQLSVYEKV